MAVDSGRLTIEQLAARTGLTVRNIRSHVTRGLLPPPHLQGRTGFYGEAHVTRLELITALQQQGFNLTAITKLVSGPVAPSAQETVDFYRTALGAWLTETPEVWSVTDLAAAFGEQPNPERVETLARLGVLERIGPEQVRVLNPALFRIGSQVLSLGFAVEDLLRILQVLAANSAVIADEFVDTFIDRHWRPYVDAGQPPAELPGLRAVIEALQPLASQAAVVAFQQAMTEAVGRAFEQLTDELAGPAVPTTAAG